MLGTKKCRMFGIKYRSMGNGLNFRKSIYNPDSHLRKMIRYLRKKCNGAGATKWELLRFGLKIKSPSIYTNRCRGYLSYQFTLAHRLKILVPVRENGSVYWYLGPNADKIDND